MRLASRREIIRALLTMVLLVALLQIIQVFTYHRKSAVLDGYLPAVDNKVFSFSRENADRSRRVVQQVVPSSKPSGKQHITAAPVGLAPRANHLANAAPPTPRTIRIIPINIPAASRRQVTPASASSHNLTHGAEGSSNNLTHVATMKSNASESRKAKDLVFSGKVTPPLLLTPDQFLPPKYNPITHGVTRNYTGFLTIGIPSIRRATADTIYLLQTLQSLIDQTTPDYKLMVTVVVLLSDFNQTYNTELCGILFNKFRRYIDAGFIRVLKPPNQMYPDFDKIKRTYNDGRERLKWRAKQNIDFAYLFLYSMNVSDYYIQLEDDVICASNFTTHIRSHIDSQSKPWFMLEYSRLGFIGKLFHSSKLQWIARFMLESFDSQPGDLMLGRMMQKSGQKLPIHSWQSLFQHNGKFSSLRNKLMPSIDNTFKDAEKLVLPIMQVPKGDHPEALISTSFETVPGYPSHLAYDQNSTSFYWAKNVKKRDFFQLTFTRPCNFSRIIIATGDEQRKKDSLLDTELMVAPMETNSSNQSQCKRFKRISMFVDGEIDTKVTGLSIPQNIKCLRLVPRKPSKTWVKIREIVLMYERNNVNNLKTIASMLGNDKVYVRGSRLIPRSETNDRSGRNDGNNRRSEQHGGWEEVRHGNRNHRRNQASTSRSHTARDAHSNERYSQQRYHGNSQPSYIRRH